MFLWHCTSATLLAGKFYFVWGFFVRRSEIVFYVLVKETDRKINLSVEKKKRSSWKRNFSMYLFYVFCIFVFSALF